MEAFTRLEALAAPLPRANIDTDQIVPALYLQKPRSDNFGDYLFHDVRHDVHGRRRDEFVLNAPVYADARILVAGPNFGCGSSREHAVWALYDGGFRAVIAPSFGDIFFNNCMKNGIVPVRLEEKTCTALREVLKKKPGSEITVDLQANSVATPIGEFGFRVPPFFREMLLEGLDEIGLTLSMLPAIEAFEKDYEADTPWLTPLR